jgi:hypothetical protein
MVKRIRGGEEAVSSWPGWLSNLRWARAFAWLFEDGILAGNSSRSKEKHGKRIPIHGRDGVAWPCL